MSEEHDWRKELQRLRTCLRELEEHHASALQGLRAQISALESRLARPPQVDAPPVPSVRATITPRAGEAIPTAAAAPAPAPTAPTPEFAKPAAVPPPLPSKPQPARALHSANNPPNDSLEFRLGRIWFVRLGIALLLTGLVLLGNYAYQNWVRDLPNGVRLAALYLCSGALAETGRRLAKREKLMRFGEVILAGGLAFFYYCTFAAHHVDRLRVIDSPIFAALILFLAAGAIGAVAWIRQAKATAVLGLLLASYSTMLQPIGWLSCLSNVLLAASGVALMLRPGWAGPGVAAMAGIYASFFGWQIAGAAGETADDSSVILWFLPPVWTLFAIPGTLARFRAAMSERWRFWFAGANNAAFFILFSALWLMREWNDSYWLVCGAFGAVLLVLGAFTRRQTGTTGSVHVSHGLGLLSLALVLKLDGHHLGLALAGESLVLAFAARRFRTHSEFVISWIAGLIGVGVMLFDETGLLRPSGSVPLWSAGLAATLVGLASVVLNRAAADQPIKRQGAGILFFAALLAMTVGFILELPEPWPLPAMAALATALAAFTLHFDPQRKMIEIGWGSLAVLAAGAISLATSESPPAIAATAVLAMVGCWLWHRFPTPSENLDARSNLAVRPELGGWMNAGFVAAAAWMTCQQMDLEISARLPLVAAAGVALVLLAIVTNCSRLAPLAALLPLAAALESTASPAEPWSVAALSWAGLILLALHFRPDALLPQHRLAAGGWLRLSGFIAWCFAWARHAPETWGDWIAVSALALVIAASSLRRPLFHEATAFLVVAGTWLVWRSIEEPWLEFGTENWRGAGVVIAFLAAAVTQAMRPSLFKSAARDRVAREAVNFVACAIASLWVTQMLVWRHGWQPASVAWTALGFSAISSGLWLRLRAFRISGFLLLAAALLKLFAVDVWDFTAFTRVVSFIALGVVLMLLGLFYHRFAPVLKRMLDDQR